MKIYTKKGDGGTTGLIGGTRVSKGHLRIDAYGEIDELNSYIGMIMDQQPGEREFGFLEEIQNDLFVLGSHLAEDPEGSSMQLPSLEEERITQMEKEMDRMNEEMPELRHFILPGGTVLVSYCHIARCVCRRSERAMVRLSLESKVDKELIKYVNRLSDYLFVLSRYMLYKSGVSERKWEPKKS